MNSFRARLLAPCLGVALLSSAPVHAAELGLYVGFLYGDGSKDFDTGPLASITTQFYRDVDVVPDTRVPSQAEKGESYGFLAGYRMNQYLAVEGGYLYLGKQSYREAASGFYIPDDPELPPSAEDWSVSLTTRSKGFAISALGILPISYAWEVYGRAGIFLASNTLSFYASSPAFSGPLRTEVSESSTEWLAGVGISMSIAEVYQIRAEYTRIFDVGKAVFGEADVDLVSVGITVAF
jgi:hypothetical protein